MIKPQTQAGKSINRLSALVELGIFELSARIIDLENHGFIVNKERKTVTNRFNEKTSVTEYSFGSLQNMSLKKCDEIS